MNNDDYLNYNGLLIFFNKLKTMFAAKDDIADGVSIVSVEQTTTSTEDGGINVITTKLSNGTTSTFYS